jgi:hypothetical protein
MARHSGALLQLVPAALQKAIAEDVQFREGLPAKYLDYTGIVNSDIVSFNFLDRVQQLFAVHVLCPPLA